jgi:hypothetical protein
LSSVFDEIFKTDHEKRQNFPRFQGVTPPPLGTPLFVTVSDGAFMMSVTVGDGLFMMYVTVNVRLFVVSVTSVTTRC